MRNFAFSLLFLAGGSSAASWYTVSQDDTRMFQIDLDSVADVSGYKKIWTKEILFKDRPVPTDTFKFYNKQMGLWYYDCKGKRTSVPASYFYNKDGEVVGGTTKPFRPAQMEDIIPDSIGEEIGKIACETNQAVIAALRKTGHTSAEPAVPVSTSEKQPQKATRALTDDQIFEILNKGRSSSKTR
jgi:hypothetical protein